MSNKTQLQTNNASLEAYIARINAVKEVAAGLPEAGGEGASTTLFGSYTFTNLDSLLSSGINMEIVFEEGNVGSYFYSSLYGDCVEGFVNKIIFTTQTLEIIPYDSVLEKKTCSFDNDYGWQSDGGAVLMDGWEKIINFVKPTVLSQQEYDVIIGILAGNGEAYHIGYNLGYSYGYSECEAEMGSDNILAQFGVNPMYVANMTDINIFINGSNAMGGVVPCVEGPPINFTATFCTAEEFSSTYLYAVQWTDLDSGEYDIIASLNPIYTEMSSDNVGTFVSGIIEDFYYPTPDCGIIITTEEL